MTIRDNAEKRRFEMEVNGLIVVCDYRRDGDIVALTHVEAPVSLRGTGAAGRLMEGIVALAEAEGLKLRPRCSYAVAWLERHPKFDHLLA